MFSSHIMRIAHIITRTIAAGADYRATLTLVMRSMRAAIARVEADFAADWGMDASDVLEDMELNEAAIFILDAI